MRKKKTKNVRRNLLCCPDCQKMHSKDAETCPQCGRPNPHSSHYRNAQDQNAPIPGGDNLITSVLLGKLHSKIICPHCQRAGGVHVKYVSRRSGISGTKAALALLSGGLSLIPIGLSRRENASQAYCMKCRARWDL